MTLFTKIIKGEIPGKILYQDDMCAVIQDINPQAPVHVLLVPKKEIPSMNDVKAEDREILAHLMLKVPEIAKQLGVAESGYRVVVNTNSDAGQTVSHIHIHILGGRTLHWPPG